MTKAEFAPIIKYLAVGIGRDPTVDEIEVYFDLLGDLDAATAQQAARRAKLQHRYPNLPPPGLIRECAAALAGEQAASVGDAWRAVLRFVQKWGRWLEDGLPTHARTKADFDADYNQIPELARRAAEAYGWESIDKTESKVAFAHFRQIYESMATRRETESALPEPLKTPVPLTIGIGSMPALETGDAQ